MRQPKLHDSPAEWLKTTPAYVQALDDMGIRTVEDLLLYLPRAHSDLSNVETLSQATVGEKVVIRGTVRDLELVRTRHGKKFVKGMLHDMEEGVAEVIWFNQPHIMRMLREGEEVLLTGKLVEKDFKLQLQSPAFERVVGAAAPVHSGKLVPVYPQHDIVTSAWLREKMLLVKKAIALLPETLPESTLAEEHLLGRAETVEAMHFPDDIEQVKKAKERLVFEEMYKLQKEALARKLEWQGETQERLQVPLNAELIRTFFASLKFTPTDGQRIAIYEILKDMERSKPMSRLLEGDVGSGKTLVATAVMMNVLEHGGQCALMVPTEVLARQHAENIARLLLALHTHRSGQTRLPTVGLLTGSVSKGEADDIKSRLASGLLDLVVGTHALLEESVAFKNLLLVVVDEQHRFGVLQRERLKEKGNPHFLSMTATPIPRTLALTAFGHHDLSVLSEKPGNRKIIHTKVVPPKDRKLVERFIDEELKRGRQAFVICPLIAASESEDISDVKNVTQEAERLREEFPHRRIALLHGKMSADEKQRIMAEFKARESDILVSTSVIEVGIDVPNATIMIVEGAERFGLAQLHQLRGRVGRGDDQSHCFLFSTDATQAKSERLRAMEKEHSGFLLAEIDLQIRGPGELYGIRQSGLPEFQKEGLLNPELVVRARRAVERELAGS